jgi:type IV pilus assembly protein PilB
MSVSEEIERLTVQRASAMEIQRVARDQGMQSLRLDGMEKVGLGVTSIEEILRVVV